MAILQMFRDDGKIGYRNEDNEVIIDAFFEKGIFSFGSGSETHCPFGYVVIDGRYGIINEKGRIVEQLEYQNILFMLDNLFMVKKGDKWDTRAYITALLSIYSLKENTYVRAYLAGISGEARA